MLDFNSFPSSVQKKLETIAKRDGNSNNLSALDLAKTSKNEIKEIIQELKKDGYNTSEQELVDVLYKLTSSDSIDLSNKTAKAYSMTGNAISNVSLPDLDIKPDEFIKDPMGATDKIINKSLISAYSSTRKDLREGIINSKTLNKSDNEIMGDYITFTKNSVNYDYINQDWRINAAMNAKEKLENTYNFKPSNPYDLKEIKNFAKNISPEKVPDFIQTYLTANYEHCGKNTEYLSLLSNKETSKSVFFGNPPKLEQIPDGRRLLDCEGFAMVGNILFDTLVNDKNSYYMPLQASGKSYKEVNNGKKTVKKGENVGHEVGFMKIKDKFYMVDNNTVNEVKLNDKEKLMVNKFIEMKNHSPLKYFDVGGIEVEKEMFPSLYNYFESNWGWKEVSIDFDEGSNLK